MLRRFSFVAVGPVFLLAAAALAGEPVFDRKAGHPWDQVRDIFYARHFTTGETFDDPNAFSPPYLQYIAFVQDATFHEQVLARLSAVENLPAAQMEEQPAIRRFLFIRSLWPVFDGLQRARGVEQDKDATATAKAVARRDELLGRVARIMRRLELTEDEARSLPNALKMLGEKKRFAVVFDPAKPEEPFFPADILDKDGPWVTYSQKKEPSAGGVVHMGVVQERSLFTLHLRTPDGRAEGVKFLEEFTKSNGKQADVPPGTMLALLRRAVVPAKGGKLVVSPFVESLQLIVDSRPKHHFFKFVLDRPEVLAGGPGLRPITKDDPADTTGFEAAILWPHPNEPRTNDVNGETLVATRYKTLSQIPPAQGTCIRCHGTTRIFGSTGPQFSAFLQNDPEATAGAVVKKKEGNEEWKSYLRLRTAQGK